jgi:crotonobetainyl-CoA:carnitine CoA-transferase CaiB-like acyl-CoA transferase
VTLDLGSPQGIEAAKKLCGTADVFLENFRPGALEAKGLGYEALSKVESAPHLLLAQGIPSGPLRKAHGARRSRADDERAAYMTGPVGRPPCAPGAPVNDMMGGMFGAIAVMAALRERDRTGKGQLVQSGLFENAAWLVSTHMMQHAVSGNGAGSRCPRQARVGRLRHLRVERRRWRSSSASSPSGNGRSSRARWRAELMDPDTRPTTSARSRARR